MSFLYSSWRPPFDKLESRAANKSVKVIQEKERVRAGDKIEKPCPSSPTLFSLLITRRPK